MATHTAEPHLEPNAAHPDAVQHGGDVHEHPDHPEEHHHAHHHVSSITQLVTVFAVLLFLTVLTVSVSVQINLGYLALAVAIAVATVKAALVMAFFMHLRYDRPFNAVLFVGSFLFLGLFLFFALVDSTQYQNDIKAFTSSGQSPVVTNN
jgi:cytochrome c oxidase subunit IV